MLLRLQAVGTRWQLTCRLVEIVMRAGLEGIPSLLPSRRSSYFQTSRNHGTAFRNASLKR
jgi:hypothetical protein